MEEVISEYKSMVDELEHALGFVPDYRNVYNRMNRVFMRSLDMNTRFARLNLSGPFAKTDYLLKEHHASKSVIHAINDTRVRLRRREELSDAEIEDNYLLDYRNIHEFLSLIYDVPVPVHIQSLKVRGGETVKRHLIGECMRVVVNRWDNEYVYANSADNEGDEFKICYAKGNKLYDFDWTYLNDLFYEGAQLNLVRPREEEEVLFPELIIFEPDYLVDVSTVANCFTPYAESADVHILRKLQPQVNSEAIMLGNFAGQLLDETMQGVDDTTTYVESINTYFKKNALNLLTADVKPSFHADAQIQKRNISYAMKVQLPNSVQRFVKDNGMVEPSFFSEMLGLQGRMDYIQMDQGVILEQKSGKGEYPYDKFITPRLRKEHYIQILLYMLIFRYNYREKYEENNRELYPFLLYSKYQQSLIGVGFAPQLIFDAIRLRNSIAWTDMQCANPDGYSFLDGMTPETINRKRVKDRLWEEYQRPQIDSVLSPIHAASELERAYYYRFLTFVSNEHVLSKLGNRTKENSGFASKWHDSLDEKLQAGNIYSRLTLVSPSEEEEGRVERVVLRFAENEENNMSNFRSGDIVILYPYEEGHEPDARKNMVFRCTIEDITIDEISLSLRNSQINSRIFLADRDRPWAIEHDFFESSYASLYKGLHAFLSAPRDRRNLLLFQRQPRVDTSLRLKGDYGTFNELSLHVKQAQDLFIIIGPPGTGKTSFGMLNTVKEELLEEGSSVLVLSYTNRAVDEICTKLIESGIDFIRLGNAFSCSEQARPYLLDRKLETCPKISDFKQLITSTRVFVGTTTAYNSQIALFQLRQFSLAIIDEASQILEPHLIGLLSAHKDGVPAIRKFVMIGDHKQLPAVVQQRPEVSCVTDPILNAIHLTDCRLSLFERILKQYAGNEAVIGGLVRQGRMHPDIALFPNIHFYGGRLDIVPRPHQQVTLPATYKSDDPLERMLRTRRIAFIASPLPKETNSDKVNLIEAQQIAKTVQCIYNIERDSFSVEDTLGIIVPYRNQIATVRTCIDRLGIPELHDIAIDTVERYQGSQRKYIIYGFTIQKDYQLDFLTNNTFEDIDGTLVDRKLNVAMTRAEEHLIMFGNARLLSKNTTFRQLIDFCHERKCLFKSEMLGI